MRKCLTPQEVGRLRRAVKKHELAALESGARTPVRDRLVVELALATGLRVMEIVQLRCGDLLLGHDSDALIVRQGKGGRRRLVRFSSEFANLCRVHLLWKEGAGEPMDPEAPILMSSNTGGPLTTRAVQKAFKRCAARAGLPPRYSIHCLRHTYACALYKASGYNLRLVQKQLGHARIATTQVYADVMDPDVRRALERLYA